MFSTINVKRADLRGADPDANSGPESEWMGVYARSIGSAGGESLVLTLESGGPGRRDNNRPGMVFRILFRQDFNNTAAATGVNLN